MANTLNVKKVMVRYILVLSGFLIISLQNFAQPTLDSAEDYKIGNERQYVAGYPDSINSIKKGANITWDFNNLGKQDSFMQKILLPDSVEDGEQFPNADLVEWYGNGNKVFHDKGSQVNDYVGLESSRDITIEFIRPVSILERPFTYNDQYLDSGRRQYTFDGFDVKGSGTSLTQAIAYGTLKLPDTVYNNTLLVRNYQDWRDTVDVPFVTPVVENQVISYSWFTKNSTYPVLRFDTIQFYSDSDQAPDDANDTIERLRYYKPLPKEDPDTSDSTTFIQRKQDIVKDSRIVRKGDQLLIQGRFRRETKLYLSLVTIDGKPLASHRMTFEKGFDQEVVPLNDLSKGFYMVVGRSAQTGEKVLGKKIFLH